MAKNDNETPLANQDELVWKARKRLGFFGLPWTFTVYKLTRDRLCIKKGFFTTTEDEIRLYRITDVSLRRTLGQKLFGMGSIFCNSSDKTMGNFEIKNIKKSADTKSLLSDLVEKERMEKRVANREFIGDLSDDNNDDLL